MKITAKNYQNDGHTVTITNEHSACNYNRSVVLVDNNIIDDNDTRIAEYRAAMISECVNDSDMEYNEASEFCLNKKIKDILKENDKENAKFMGGIFAIKNNN